MRSRIAFVLFALLVAACGGGAEQTGGNAAPETTASPTPTAPVATQAPSGPPAPNFTTILSDGTEFTLSAHDKPVYMVFWAYW